MLLMLAQMDKYNISDWITKVVTPIITGLISVIGILLMIQIGDLKNTISNNSSTATLNSARISILEEKLNTADVYTNGKIELLDSKLDGIREDIADIKEIVNK